MSTYISLGPRVASVNQGQVSLDPTGMVNNGNWVVQYQPNDMNCQMPYFEVSHIVINGAPGSQFTVFIDTFQWDTNQNGYSNSWDPAVPMPLKPGQILLFNWSNSDANLPPAVTIWLRYDVDIPSNRAALLGYPSQ